MNTAIRSQNTSGKFGVEPVLRKVLSDARKEHDRIQEMFELLGWRDLPDRLKMEIKEDVSAMVDELQGQYSTCDPFILKRRESVTYWVDCYQAGICSLDTAVEALKVRKL